MTDSLAHIPSGLTMQFLDQIQGFDDYLVETRKLIQRAHSHITDENECHIIETCGPKAFYPNNPSTKPKGMLLIHGLLDSCAIMSSLYDHYSQKGYVVKSILLPGHGTRPADLFDVKWEDWAKCCEFAIHSFKQEVDTLHVAALSTGACLASYFALNHAPIDKLVLFAPAFQLKTHTTPLIRICQYMNTSLPLLKKNWLFKHEETDISKYRSIAVNGVYQLLTLMGKTTPRLLKEQLKQPLYLVLSADDETISNQKAIDCFSQQKNPDNQLLIFGNEETQFKGKNIEVLPSCLPNENILNFSHVCLTVSPTHPLYGKNAKLPSNHYLGAITPSNLINYTFERLTYNPYFSTMLSKIDTFLEGDTP
jgi:esterase/lipase